MTYRYELNQPRKGWLTVSDGSLPWPVSLRVARDVYDRPVIVALLFDPPEEYEVTPTTVREAPIGDILRDIQARLSSGDPIEQVIPRPPISVRFVRRRGLRSALGRQHFESVADQVHQHPDLRPLDALRLRWPDVSYHTHRRWLQRATDMGLLATEDRPVEIDAHMRDLERQVTEARAARRAGGGQKAQSQPKERRAARGK